MKSNNLMMVYVLILVGGIVFSCGNQESDPGKTSTQAETSTSFPIGIALYSFNRFPFIETLDMAKQSGASRIEGFFFHKLGGEFGNKSMLDLSDEGLRKMKKLVDDKGLDMPSVYAGAKNKEEWKRFFKIGEILDLDFLVCEPEPEHWDLLDSLGGASSIKIAIHEHARGKSRYWHPDSVLVALEGRPNIGACGDLGHWVRSGLDPVECLKRLQGHLISIHAKDLDEFGNVDANDVNIGTGVIDYGAVVKELDRQGFDGPVFIECEHNWEDNLRDVKAGINYLQRID